jgi:hypothetical protein
VIKRGKKKNKDGCGKYITLGYVRQGMVESSTSSNAMKPNPTIKTGCKAKINEWRAVDGKWFLNIVVVEHNHSLSPGKVRFFRCNKSLDSPAKRRLELNDRVGIRPCKNFNSLVVEMGRGRGRGGGGV